MREKSCVFLMLFVVFNISGFSETKLVLWGSKSGKKVDTSPRDNVSDVVAITDKVYVLGNTSGYFHQKPVLKKEYLTDNRMFITNLNQKGEVLWSKAYDSQYGHGSNMMSCGNHLYVLTNRNKLSLLKMDFSGKVLLTKKIMEKDFYSYYGYVKAQNIIMDQSCNLYIVGTVDQSDQTIIQLIKVNSLGKVVFEKQHTLFENHSGKTMSIMLDSRGDLVVTGVVTDENSSKKKEAKKSFLFVTKFNQSGKRLWLKTVDTSDEPLQGYGVINQKDEIFITGIKNNQVKLTKLGRLGRVLWHKKIKERNILHVTAMVIHQNHLYLLAIGKDEATITLKQIDFYGITLMTRTWRSSFSHFPSSLCSAKESLIFAGWSAGLIGKLEEDHDLVTLDGKTSSFEKKLFMMILK